MPRRPKPAPPQRRRRNSGSLTTLPDGSILARAPASLDPRRRSREFPPGRRDLAEAWLDSILHPGAAGTTAPVTLGEWIDVWFETYVEPVRPSTTARRYSHSLRLLASLYGTPLPDLRPSQLQALIGQLTLTPATIQGAVGVWRRCLEDAVDDGHITRNPARRLILPRAAPTEQRHVSPAEAAALWPEIIGHRMEGGLALSLGCGLRIGEILALAWEDVNLAQRTARIRRQWADGRMRETPKGGRARTVRLPPPVVAALIRHRNAQPSGAELVMQSPHPPSRKSKRKASEPRPWSPTIVRGDLAALVARLKLPPGVTPHAARRGLTSALLDGRISPAVVADILGHSNPSTTLRYYAKSNEEARQLADELVDRYLGDGPEDVPGTESTG